MRRRGRVAALSVAASSTATTRPASSAVTGNSPRVGHPLRSTAPKLLVERPPPARHRLDRRSPARPASVPHCDSLSTAASISPRRQSRLLRVHAILHEGALRPNRDIPRLGSIGVCCSYRSPPSGHRRTRSSASHGFRCPDPRKIPLHPAETPVTPEGDQLQGLVDKVRPQVDQPPAALGRVLLPGPGQPGPLPANSSHRKLPKVGRWPRVRLQRDEVTIEAAVMEDGQRIRRWLRAARCQLLAVAASRGTSACRRPHACRPASRRPPARHAGNWASPARPIAHPGRPVPRGRPGTPCSPDLRWMRLALGSVAGADAVQGSPGRKPDQGNVDPCSRVSVADDDCANRLHSVNL